MFGQFGQIYLEEKTKITSKIISQPDHLLKQNKINNSPQICAGHEYKYVNKSTPEINKKENKQI